MARITLLFFGAVAQALGEKERAIEAMRLSEVFSAEFIAALEHRGLNFSKLRYSLNARIIEGDAALKDGDEVALFSTFSGG